MGKARRNNVYPHRASMFESATSIPGSESIRTIADENHGIDDSGREYTAVNDDGVLTAHRRSVVALTGYVPGEALDRGAVVQTQRERPNRRQRTAERAAEAVVGSPFLNAAMMLAGVAT